MFCSQCGTEINDDSTECHSCGETTRVGQSELSPGRKTGAAALRSLGMVILIGSIIVWLGLLLVFESTFPIILLILACAVGAGMHYAGRKMDPHAHSATAHGVVGGVLGGIVIIIGMAIALLIVIVEFIKGIFGQ